MQNLKCVSRTNVREALVCKGDKKLLLFILYINQDISRQNSIFNVKWTNIWIENNSDNINTRQIE